MIPRVLVLDALLEGFSPGAHPRDFHGRWIATFAHSVHGTVTSPVDAGSSSDAWQRAARLGMGTVQNVVPFDSVARGIAEREGRVAAAGGRATSGLPLPYGARRRLLRAPGVQASEVSPVLGALLEGAGERVTEGAIGHIEKGAFHRWLGKGADEPITDADIQRGLAAGGHPAKMAAFAKAARKFGR